MLGSSLNFIWEERKKCVPKIRLTNMANYENIIAGLSYTFNRDAPKMTDSLETIIGFTPKANNVDYMAYVKS